MRSDSFRFVSLRADPHHRSQITDHSFVLRVRARATQAPAQGAVEMRPSRADIKYNCWVPSSGLSSPAVTVISQFQLSNATQASFVTNNRLAWAAAQRYRYCELGVRPDQLRQSWAWARIPLLLATLRCSDYVVHLDADAFVMRPEWGVESYLRQMQERRASLLVTRDYLDLKRSPINFGVCSPDAGDGPRPSQRRDTH